MGADHGGNDVALAERPDWIAAPRTIVRFASGDAANPYNWSTVGLFVGEIRLRLTVSGEEGICCPHGAEHRHQQHPRLVDPQRRHRPDCQLL